MSEHGPAPTPLFVVRGEASAEQVAALTVVLQALGAGAPSEGGASSEWSAPHRRTRGPLRPGPGAWRSSGLPH